MTYRKAAPLTGAVGCAYNPHYRKVLMPSTETIASLRLTRDLPDRSRVVGAFAIRRIGGNPHPHFSATGELYEAHGTWSGAAQERNGRESDCGGCIHDELLRAFPAMAPFVALHLSDWPSGQPMHAAANARYFIEQGDARAAASMLRCAVEDLPDLTTGDAHERRAAMAAFVDAQRERWAAEAQAARELLP